MDQGASRYFTRAIFIGCLTSSTVGAACNGHREGGDAGTIDGGVERGLLSATGNMTTARRLHTATLLPSSKVLVAGGIGPTSGEPSRVLSTAELYDPVSGEFTVTGSMIEARYTHTATLLSNGMVLVAGGTGTSSNLASTELYDPASGVFLSAASMSTARVGHAATSLLNGMVLVTGGWAGGLTDLSTAELYDPSTRAFRMTGNMTIPRDGHTATLLSNGKVLIAGQVNSASAELYDPAIGSFTAIADMTMWRWQHTATLLLDGTVLIAGGVVLNGSTPAAELYDPASGIFRATGNMTTSRRSSSATLLPSGDVLIVGGAIDNGSKSDFLASADLYGADVGAFGPTENMAGPRVNHTATLLPNGEVLIAGGVNSESEELSSAALYP